MKQRQKTALKKTDMEEAADSQSTSDSASEPDQNTLSSGEQSQNTPDENPTGGALSDGFSVTPILIFTAAAAVIALLGTALTVWIGKSRRREEAERMERRRKRMERLKETGVSEEEFNEMMKNRRLSIPLEPDKRSPRRKGSSKSFLLSQPKKKRTRDSEFTLKKRRRWKR